MSTGKYIHLLNLNEIDLLKEILLQVSPDILSKTISYSNNPETLKKVITIDIVKIKNEVEQVAPEQLKIIEKLDSLYQPQDAFFKHIEKS